MNQDEAVSVLAARIDRRTALRWIMAATASLSLSDRAAHGAEFRTNAKSAGAGYGSDPDLIKDYKPGDLWPLTFNDAQRLAASALCDVIIPADAHSPSAATLGVHDFIDEWISAPYPQQVKDRAIVLEGLAWIDAESRRRFGLKFSALVSIQTDSLCDDICHVPTAQPAFQPAARFFKKFRDLTAGGFYTTKEGMKDIGYTGNVPLAAFDGPPQAVLQQLGLV